MLLKVSNNIYVDVNMSLHPLILS